MNIIFEFVNKKNKLIKKNILQKGRLYKILKYKNCGFTKNKFCDRIYWGNRNHTRKYLDLFARGPVGVI